MKDHQVIQGRDLTLDALCIDRRGLYISQRVQNHIQRPSCRWYSATAKHSRLAHEVSTVASDFHGTMKEIVYFKMVALSLCNRDVFTIQRFPSTRFPQSCGILQSRDTTLARRPFIHISQGLTLSLLNRPTLKASKPLIQNRSYKALQVICFHFCHCCRFSFYCISTKSQKSQIII